MNSSERSPRRVARFRVRGRIGMAGGSREATVSIDRTTGVVEVRPLRSREVYTMRLCDLIDMMVERQLIAEARQVRELRKAKRRAA